MSKPEFDFVHSKRAAPNVCQIVFPILIGWNFRVVG